MIFKVLLFSIITYCSAVGSGNSSTNSGEENANLSLHIDIRNYINESETITEKGCPFCLPLPTKKKRKIDDGSPPQTDTSKKRKTTKPTLNEPEEAVNNLFKIQYLNDRLGSLKNHPDDLLQKMYDYLKNNLKIPISITKTYHENRLPPNTIACLTCTGGTRPYAYGLAFRWTGINDLLNLIHLFTSLYHNRNNPKDFKQIQILSWIVTYQTNNAYSFTTNAVIKNYQSLDGLDTRVNTLNSKYEKKQLPLSDRDRKIINLFTNDRPREKYSDMLEGLKVDNNARFTDALERAFIDPPYLQCPITKVGAYTAQFISTVFLSEPVRAPLVHVTNMLTIDVMVNCYKKQHNLQLFAQKKLYNQKFISRLVQNPMALLVLCAIVIHDQYK